LQASARFQPERKHDHVELFFGLLHRGAGMHEPKVPRARHFIHAGNKRAHVADTQLVFRAIAVTVEILAESAEIKEEDRYVKTRLVLLGEDSFLGGGHAAN